jgi:imidazoleglycerol-phosphate dehydratase
MLLGTLEETSQAEGVQECPFADQIQRLQYEAKRVNNDLIQLLGLYKVSSHRFAPSIAHHSVEDVGIALGQALKAALGDKKGIVRFGHAFCPLDEALTRAVVDLSGRPWLHMGVAFRAKTIGDMPTELFEDFFWALADHGRLNLHLDLIRGRNSHHIAESTFKATARALAMAVALDPRQKGVPSTKGTL